MDIQDEVAVEHGDFVRDRDFDLGARGHGAVSCKQGPCPLAVTRRQLTDDHWKFIEPYLPIGEYGPYPERLREQFDPRSL
ncbi:hypothetical protein [Streptomyces adustus]|uniref:hypothetical protein n=1 Tax=Streptomyces adustus TaxID=1609272 RepID=UPI00371AD906